MKNRVIVGLSNIPQVYLKIKKPTKKDSHHAYMGADLDIRDKWCRHHGPRTKLI